MRQLPSSSEQNDLANSVSSENYEPPHLQDLGKWQAATLAMSLPVGPGSNAFNDPDAFFKKVEW